MYMTSATKPQNSLPSAVASEWARSLLMPGWFFMPAKAAHSGYVITREEYYYQGYCHVLEGSPSADKRAYVDSERRHLGREELEVALVGDQARPSGASLPIIASSVVGLPAASR